MTVSSAISALINPPAAVTAAVNSTVNTDSTAAVTPAAVNAAASSAGISSSDFLNLLVGELQNQDPLAPTSTSDFITQMSQYASFDQQQTLNTNLQTLLTSFNSLLTMNSLNYIGHTVQAKGNTASLQGGQAAFGYSLTSAASQVQLSIQDSTGTTVWSGTGPTAAGMNSFTWNGVNSGGVQLPDGGQYTLSVTATGATGTSVYGYTTVTGKVNDIDSSSGSTMLDIGGVPVNINNVIGVKS